jgi:type I restriction-modification system DNA methylase subunit
LEYNTELNQKLHNHKITEDKRSLLISGILIALEHGAFRNGYNNYNDARELSEYLVNTVINGLKKSSIQETKIGALANAYNFIQTNSTLSSDIDFFKTLIKEVDEKINSFVKTYKFYDIFGEFYTEFLRYANADKGLGIVLTPKHITELFCEIAQINKDSVVFDNCCGTGGFLITAMREMLELANHNKEKEKHIKRCQIVGIEYQDNLFPLLCSNMIIHGDGKTNLYNEDCFKINKNDFIRNKFKPTIGFLNPPFKTDKNDTEEFEFVLNNLEGLIPGSICVALLPMSCVLAQSGKRRILKEKILNNHTLEAVVSLPDELFYNSKTSVVTCAIVITANRPHLAEKETYFGYWKDDGFVKRKNKGRIDGGNWNIVKNKWTSSYRNKTSVPGISVMQKVSAGDEWCAEAYMETDYSKLTKEDFIKTIKDYVAYNFLSDPKND